MQKGPYFQNVAAISSIPEGYMQTATSSGRNIAAGIESFGSSIAKGIDQYYKNEEERAILGSTITQYLKSDSKIAESLDPKLLQKFSDGKASLKDHKDMFAAIGTNVLLNDKKQRDQFQAQQLKLLGENLTNAQNQNAEFTRLKQEREAFNAAIKNNSEFETGKVDWQGVGRTLMEGGFNPFSDNVAKAAQNDRAINFTGPKATTLDLGGGNSAAVVETAPGENSVINMPATKPVAPESPLGKLMEDRDRALADGRKQDAESIQKTIDAETAKAQQGGQNLDLADETFIQNVREYQNQLQQIEDTIKKDGTWESAILGNEKSAAVLDQLPYKMAITYSKIVDPQSVAREGEVAAAQKYIIPTGFWANKGKALAAIQQQKDEILRRANQFAKTKNVKIEDLLTDKNQAPANTVQDEYVYENGKLVKKSKK